MYRPTFPSRSFGRRFAGPALLLLIVTAFFWKLLTRQYTWMDQPDMAYQVLPWYQFQASAWHRGEFPLWDPHLYAGQPLLGQLQPGATYPLNWLVFLMPLKDGYIQRGYLDAWFILTHFLAALFCYWLCRDLRRTRAAAVLGGLAFALSGVVGSLGWPQMLNGAIWTPLVVLFVLRSLRGERPVASAAFAGTFLGIAFLSGHHQIPTFIALTACGLWTVHIWRRKFAAVGAVLVFLLFASLTGAFQVLPAIEAGKRSIRWVGSAAPVSWGQHVPYLVHDRFSLLPLGVLGFALPGVSEFEVFAGLGVVVLALAGLTFYFGETQVRLVSAICLGAILFALGSFSVFHGVAYLVIPMVEKARLPAMALVIAHCALAVLAACGLDAIRASAPGRIWIRSLILAGIVPLGVTALMASVRPEASREYERLVIFGLAALSMAALFHGWRNLSERAALALLFMVLVFEWGTYTGGTFRHREAPGGFLAQLDQNRDIADFLRNQPDFVRLDVNGEDVPFNFGDWEGIDQQGGYMAGLTANVASAPGELFAANYFLGRKPARPAQQELFRGRSGLRVFSNPGALPFVRAIHESGQCPAADDVRLAAREDGRFTVDARMACDGTVVISETFFPGWKASVDGHGVPVREMFGAVQGVNVPAGDHRVELKYRPLSVYAGAALSSLGVLGALAIAFAGRKRNRFRMARGVA